MQDYRSNQALCSSPLALRDIGDDMFKITMLLIGLLLSNACFAADSFTQQSLESNWKGTWITPSSKFTFILNFKVDADGNITGSYGPPKGEQVAGLGGKLTLNKETGKIDGKITFAAGVEFAAQQDVKIENAGAGKDKHQRITGMFITKAFPGELGKDILDVTNESESDGSKEKSGGKSTKP
jgi:hypothetical protein